MAGKKQTTNEVEEVALTKIRTDGGTQVRAAIDEQYVEDLAALIEDGKTLPPVELVYDGEAYWMVDGFHRLYAHRKLLYGHISAIVHQGTQSDAQWRSYRANLQHDSAGMKRTNADKRRAVLAAFDHPNGKGKTDNAIAEWVGVTAPTVAKCRAGLPTIKDLKLREGLDGKVRDVSNIGKGRKAQAEPEPQPVSEPEPVEDVADPFVAPDVADAPEEPERTRASEPSADSNKDRRHREAAFGASRAAINALMGILSNNPHRVAALDEVAAWITHNR
jgi:ParB-like chromosome segregation protein Spo0J